MPKLDPDDEGQHPTSADIAAAQTSKAPSLFTSSAPAQPTPAPVFNATPTQSNFGSSAPGGFGNGNVPLGNSMSTGGFGGGFGQSRTGFGQQPVAPDANTTAAFGNLMAASEGKEPEHWMKSFWRPAMGWLYMLICFMDFVAFPMISMFLPIIEKGFGVQMGYTAWQSLTLSNGGLIHLAFGGILGVSAFGRTMEKKAGTA